MIQSRWLPVLCLPLLLLSCSSDPKEKARKLAQRSVEAQLEGKYETAGDFLKQAVELNPDFAEAYVALGQMYHYQEMRGESRDAYQQAIQLYDKRLETNPDDVNSLVNQAMVYAILSRFVSAQRLLNLAMKIEPENTTALYFMKNMKEFAGAWNQFPPPHPSEQKIQREMLAPLE